MTCREFAGFMMDYRSGELPPTVRAAFEHHLRLCPNCQRYLVSYEEAVSLGQHAFDDDEAAVPADVPEQLVKAILAARRSA